MSNGYAPIYTDKDIPHEAAMLERVSECCEVKPIGYLPFSLFSLEDLMDDIKTITDTHIKTIKK